MPILGILSAILLGVIENYLCNVGHFDMTIFGTVLFMPLFCLLGAQIFKKDPKMICDIFTICIVSGAFMARVNCFFAGCCLGRFIGNTGVRWPTREAELVFYAVIAIICVIKLSKKKFDGTLYPFFMMTYGVFRFLTELLRETEHYLFGVVDIFLFWAVLCFVIGLTFYFKNKKGLRKIKQKKKVAR